MADRDDSVRYVPALPRRELRTALRVAGVFDPPLRILAEDVLGQDAPIDFVAVDPRGCVVLVLLGEEGDDGGLFTQALAQRAWVKARLRDWLQLSPGLELSASAPVRALILCPCFSPATRAAADVLGAEVVELSAYRCIRNGARGTAVLIERVRARDGHESARTPAAAAEAAPAPRFRSGLSEDDLGLGPDEIREFE